MSSYGVEVAVPKAWRIGALPPNEACVHGGAETTAPYVEIGQFDAADDLVLCLRSVPADLPVEFGKLALRLWQPHVALRRADRVPGAPAGTWTYGGWTLQRARVGVLSISVLTRSGQADLGARVLASAHRVAVDRLGCASVAPPQLARGQLPSGRALPAAADVGSISVCQYDRTGSGAPRMAAATSIRGARARAVVRAIRAAPLGGGPDRPRDCLGTMHGDSALVLHFVGRGERPTSADPQAFVSSDWCVGNGIAEAGGRHALTRSSCRPLYARPPVVAWSAQSNVAPLCMRL
ncbi:hypothetical protein GCM10028772_29850 [Nocardioides ultimimeridianus]